MMASPSIRRRADRATFSAMTTQAIAVQPGRTVRDVAAAGVDVASLRQPVLLLLIASSALGFRLGAPR
jgi:hypothetical protein